MVVLGAAECARVLGAVCQAALDAHAAGGGLLLNYAQLPQAFWTRIAPHFEHVLITSAFCAADVPVMERE